MLTADLYFFRRSITYVCTCAYMSLTQCDHTFASTIFWYVVFRHWIRHVFIVRMCIVCHSILKVWGSRWSDCLSVSTNCLFLFHTTWQGRGVQRMNVTHCDHTFAGTNCWHVVLCHWIGHVFIVRICIGCHSILEFRGFWCSDCLSVSTYCLFLFRTTWQARGI